MCVEGVCDYAQYIQLLHAYDELAVFTGLMGATDTVRTRTKGT